ncbi:MAG: hypothetical protein ACRDT5_03405 [Mycobacterium sp.]
MLADCEQRAMVNGGTLFNPDTGASYTGSPERRAALAAGAPVDLPVSALPRSARGEELAWWRRAVVSADGAVAFYDDDGSRWLAGNGL